ncbi:MAG: response regulator [Alphaproteobacteria bacterium]|nr:response regulator [Alphaproteobacteria bacterium]
MKSETGFKGAARAGARRPVILLVEDESLLRHTTAGYLNLSGYTVIEASTAVEAISELSSGKPIGLVFSDVCLSGPADGLALARWLRQRSPDIPVMLTSGYGDLVQRAAVQLVGDERFLPKPYRQYDLAGRISRLIEPSADMGQLPTSGASKR